MTSREEKRALYERLIRRKKEARLTYRELSEESGIPARRLIWWGARLAKERTKRRSNTFVEVVPSEGAAGETSFEVVLCNERRIRVPAAFEERSLLRLVALLESGC